MYEILNSRGEGAPSNSMPGVGARAVGFLMLRYTFPRRKLWKFFLPYLLDPTPMPAGEVTGKRGGGTLGEWVETLLVSFP